MEKSFLETLLSYMARSNNFTATCSRYFPEVQMRFSRSLSRLMEGAGVADTLLGISGRGVIRALMAGVGLSLD